MENTDLFFVGAGGFYPRKCFALFLEIKLELFCAFQQQAEAYSEPCQPSKQDRVFCGNSFQSFTIFTKSSVLEFDCVLNMPLHICV